MKKGKKRLSNQVILVLTDTHFPYHHSETFMFLREMKKKFNPDRVIHTGDLVDNYHASQYLKSASHNHNAMQELDEANKAIAELAAIFPEMVLVIGNHDARVESAAERAGLSPRHLIGFKRLFGIPSGWKIKDDRFSLTVNNKGRTRILFRHYSGANALTEAERFGSCYVQGHAHKKCNIQWSSNGKKLIWGMNIPSLISDTGCPYRYDKLANQRPVRGCALIINGIPQLIPLGKVGW